MKKHCLKITMISLMILSIFPVLSLLSVQAAESIAPYSITIEPEEITVKVGDEVTYNCKIDASEGFNESIDFVLEVSTLTWDTTFDIGVLDPPYPQEFSYSFDIPESFPLDVTATGTLIGTSGEYSVEETVKITIQSSLGISGFPYESIIIGIIAGVIVLWMSQRKN